jgi:hypothetical protein
MFPLPRVIHAMASDGLIFRFLASINPYTRTPLVATILSGLFAGKINYLSPFFPGHCYFQKIKFPKYRGFGRLTCGCAKQNILEIGEGQNRPDTCITAL